MASPRRSLGERLMRWKGLVANGRQLFEQEVPQAVPDANELERVADEVARLHAQQVRLKGELRVTTKRIRELSREADRLRGRIGATVRGRFGYDSLILGSLGFKPRYRKTTPGDMSVSTAPAAGEGQELPAETPEGSETAN
jgi:hypothetical protein